MRCRHRCCCFRSLAWAAGMYAAAAAAGPEEVTAAAPANPLLAHRFEVLPDCPAVIDRQTRLMWQRCSLGQVWDGSSCHGRPQRLDWERAVGARDELCGVAGWHLPQRDELEGLVVEGGLPTIDPEVFPNTPPASFWTASTSTVHAGRAWYVSFGKGAAENVFKDASFHVRLVCEAP